MMQFSGARVRQARLEAGLTQEQLARLCDSGVGRVTSWETGRHQPTAQNLALLVYATGRPFEFFYVDEDGPIQEAAAEVHRRVVGL